MKWRANEGALSQGKTWGRKRGGGGGCWEERKGEGGVQNHGCIVVCFPNVNSRGSGTEQLNIQTAQWGSECGAAVEHGCHQDQECETLRAAFYLYRKSWLSVHTAFQIHPHIQTVNTGSYTFTPLSFIVYMHSLQGEENILTALHYIANNKRVTYITVYRLSFSIPLNSTSLNIPVTCHKAKLTLYLIYYWENCIMIVW